MEIWKDIVGYEGIYQVSDLGKVKSLQKKIPHLGSYRIINESILKGSITEYGYIVYKLGGKLNGRMYFGHRLVAKNFLGIVNEKNVVNHKNGIKTDNRLENLEWCTQLENVIHSYKMGLSNNYGEKNGNNILTTEQAIKIKYHLSHLSQKQIAEIYNIKQNTVSQIKNGIRWKNI